MNENPWKDELLERYLLGEFSQEEVNEPLERYLLGRFSQERVDELFRRYLLGELSQEEVDELELHLSMNKDLFDLAEAVEADLLAAADRGELAPEERERVLKRLASSPQGQERFALIRAFNRAANEKNVVRFPGRRAPLAQRPFVQGVIAVAASLLVVTGLLVFIPDDQDAGGESPIDISNGSTPASPVQPKVPERTPVAAPAQPATTPEQVAGDKKPEEHKEQPVTKPAEPIRAVLSLAVTNFREAGGEVDKLPLTPDLESVELRLDMEYQDQSPESFDVILRTKEEQEPILQKSGLKLRQLDKETVLVLEVPARTLTAGTSYEVRVQGVAAEGATEPPPSFAEFEVVTGGQP
ncbi:MAG TPA: hypothetical protein VF789_11600 [Thermoanaerobaculia bacterium]